MAVPAAALTHALAAVPPLELPQNSNHQSLIIRPDFAEKPPKQAVFLQNLVGVRGLGPRASCSQTCVGTFRRHSAALFGPFQRSGNSSLTLFRPACFKQTFSFWDGCGIGFCILKEVPSGMSGDDRPDRRREGAGNAPHNQRIATFACGLQSTEPPAYGMMKSEREKPPDDFHGQPEE